MTMPRMYRQAHHKRGSMRLHRLSVVRLSAVRLSAPLLLVSVCAHEVCALISISPPSSANEYRNVASLVAATFDAPATTTSSKIEAWNWNWVERSLTEEFTYKRLVSTARKMRGKKHILLVAKESDPGSDGSKNADEVVGMVEMGMSLCPVSLEDTDLKVEGSGNRSFGDASKLRPKCGTIKSYS
ncbi:hypothetical protein ACHAXT_004911 [Thalassiosira profunda]